MLYCWVMLCQKFMNLILSNEQKGKMLYCAVSMLLSIYKMVLSHFLFATRLLTTVDIINFYLFEILNVENWLLIRYRFNLLWWGQRK